jgi:hypothetical protein
MLGAAAARALRSVQRMVFSEYLDVMKRSSALAVGLAWVAVLAACPGRAGAAQSACERLHGHDLAPATSVKLVERRTTEGVDLVACALPRGRVRTIASRLTGSIYTETFRLRQVAGAFAAVTTSFDDQYASGETTSVINLRSGKGRDIADVQQDAGRAPAGVAQLVAAIFVTSGGRGAASIIDGSGGVQIVAFGAHGTPQPLDTGTAADLPPASLALTGTTVSWTHAGAVRTARLPQP